MSNFFVSLALGILCIFGWAGGCLLFSFGIYGVVWGVQHKDIIIGFPSLLFALLCIFFVLGDIVSKIEEHMQRQKDRAFLRKKLDGIKIESILGNEK